MKEYRVWDKITRSYSTDQQWSLAPNGKLYYGNAEWENAVVEFATGLKDKNGVMIYEGDIVTDGLYDQLDNSAPVVWNDAEAQFIVDYEEEPMNIWPECKVISNIHDTLQGDNA